MKKVESHPHRQALQADLQQNNAYNPFSDESKAMIREMGNVELFELCETNSESAVLRMPSFFIGIKNNPAKIFTDGDWMHSQSRTTSSRRGDLVVLGTAEPRRRKNISWPTMRGGDVSKRNLQEFTIASKEIQENIVIRNSKLAGLRRSASRWTNLHKKTTPIAHPLRSSRDVLVKTGISH